MEKHLKKHRNIRRKIDNSWCIIMKMWRREKRQKKIFSFGNSLKSATIVIVRRCMWIWVLWLWASFLFMCATTWMITHINLKSNHIKSPISVEAWCQERERAKNHRRRDHAVLEKHKFSKTLWVSLEKRVGKKCWWEKCFWWIWII